jgi:hypothetical protein
MYIVVMTKNDVDTVLESEGDLRVDGGGDNNF